MDPGPAGNAADDLGAKTMGARLQSVFQLAATLLVLVLVPGNAAKLVALLAVWAVTFRSLSQRELICFLAVNLLFSAMDIAATAQGVFRFSHPDFLGLPVWEFAMWGFYVLHLIRAVEGPPPAYQPWRVLPLAALFAVPFMTITAATPLLAASAVALGIAFAFFHERLDWIYAGYMILVGAAVEYVGVGSGLWQYPGNPPGGVEFWFITMWGGVGLFTRRLIVPLLRGKQAGPTVVAWYSPKR